MKKIAFLIMPILALGLFASPLMAGSKFSFSLSLNTLQSLFCPPVVEKHVFIAPPPPRIERRTTIIRHYYPQPSYQQEVIVVHPR